MIEIYPSISPNKARPVPDRLEFFLHSLRDMWPVTIPPMLTGGSNIPMLDNNSEQMANIDICFLFFPCITSSLWRCFNKLKPKTEKRPAHNADTGTIKKPSCVFGG